MSDIKVIVKIPYAEAYDMVIEDELQSYQRIVGGPIETVPFLSDCLLIVNEEGRLQGLEPNISIRGETIVGPVIVVGLGEEDFADVPIDAGMFNRILGIGGRG